MFSTSRLLVTTVTIALLSGCAAVKNNMQHREQAEDQASIFKGKGGDEKSKAKYMIRDFSLGRKFVYEDIASLHARAFSEPVCRLRVDPGQWRLLDGNCSNGQANGYGRAMSRAGNEVYIGEFRDGLPHGKGLLASDYHGKKYYFYGDFNQGVLEGRTGMQIIAKAYQYRLGGRWKNGRPQGLHISATQYSGVLAVKSNIIEFDNGCIVTIDGKARERDGIKGQEFCSKLGNPVQAGLTNTILQARSQPTQSHGNNKQQQIRSANGTAEQRLQKLNELKKQGLITSADYDRKKQEILNEL